MLIGGKVRNGKTRRGLSNFARAHRRVGTVSICSSSVGALGIQQLVLSLDAPAISGELSVATNNAVAGYCQRNRIRSAGASYRAHRICFSGPFGLRLELS